MGVFGDLFDLNFDGETDAFEQAAELGFLAQMMEDEEYDEYEA